MLAQEATNLVERHTPFLQHSVQSPASAGGNDHGVAVQKA